jgi:iron complex outermembrane receptor protein
MRSISLVSLLVGSAFIVTPAFGQQAPSAAADEAADETASADGTIVVFGSGQTRQVAELEADDVTILAPGTSPLKAIERLPGVNFQSADAFGSYEWSQRVSIRSFNQNQIGFTFDGVPLGDGSYGNNNGLHVSRAVISENVGRVSVSQGAGSIGTQATNNLGGTIETFSADPLGRFGVQVNGTYGSDETIRGYARVDLGTENGVAGYVSGIYGDTDKWKGFGEQQQRQINAKLVVPLGDSVKLDAWYSFSRRNEQDYQDLSLDQISRLGLNNDNIANNYALAIRIADVGANRGDTGVAPSNPAAGTVYPAPYATVDDVYFDAAGIRRDHLAYLGLRGTIGEEGSFLIRGYYHSNKGQGLWGTPYRASAPNLPLSLRTTEYDIDRKGVFASLSLPISITDLTVGAWYEKTDFEQARRFYAFDSRTEPGRSFTSFQSNPFFTQWNFLFDTETLQYHIQDTIDLGALKVNLGWKGFRVTNEATPIVAGGLASGRIKTEDWFQPHVGFAYELANSAEIFGGFTQATRAFVSASTAGPFATTPAGFAAIRNTLKPETSETFELGLRYNSSVFNGVLAVYYVDFANRLLSIPNGVGIIGNPAIQQNVGSVRSLGFEAGGEVRFGQGFSGYMAYAYNDATYRDDVVNGTGARIAATRGKRVVDSPEHILRAEVAYDQGPIFGRIGGNYMSKRFFNFENDRSVGSRFIVDATLGYRVNDNIEVQLNATNLFDEAYVGTIGSNGFGNRGDNQTLLAGAPQQFFVTVKFGF